MLTQADVHWIELDSVDSTNDYLARNYQQSRVSGHVAVLAHQQTAGRGRAGRVWKATQGASLCLSVGMPVAGHRLPGLPLCVGVAVAEYLEELGVPVRLKWPNDLLVGQQKLGGLLCESFQVDGVPVTVVGLGLNIHAVDVPDAMTGQGAVSLATCLPASSVPGARDLAEQLVPRIVNTIDGAMRHGVADVFTRFRQRDVWLGQAVRVLDNGVVCLEGRAMGLDEQGAYLIETSQGLQAVYAGDLSLREQA